MGRIFLNENWLPKSVLCLRTYDRHKFLLDLIAGVTVGLVALPLAMAFAIASGLTPQAGIYCAIVTGFLISALGGSKTQIGGPTGAFVVVTGAPTPSGYNPRHRSGFAESFAGARVDSGRSLGVSGESVR